MYKSYPIHLNLHLHRLVCLLWIYTPEVILIADDLIMMISMGYVHEGLMVQQPFLSIVINVCCNKIILRCSMN